MKWLSIMAAIAFVCGQPLARVQASTVIAMSMTDLAKQADVIVHGVVVAKKAKRHKGRIITECTLQVEEVAYGNVTPGQKVKVLLLGGEMGDIGMRVIGEPECGSVGDKVVIAAAGAPNALRPIGMSQGWFPVHNDLVQPSGDGLHRLAPNATSPTGGKAALRESAAIMNGPEDVHSFIDRFRSLAKAGHAEVVPTSSSPSVSAAGKAGEPNSSATKAAGATRSSKTKKHTK